MECCTGVWLVITSVWVGAAEGSERMCCVVLRCVCAKKGVALFESSLRGLEKRLFSLSFSQPLEHLHTFRPRRFSEHLIVECEV